MSRQVLAHLVQDIFPQVVLVPQAIALEHGHVGMGLEFLAGQLLELRIDLDRDHPGCLGSHAGRQRTHTGSDLEHHVMVVEPGGGLQQIQQVQVDEEVLAILGLRLQAGLLEATG